MREKISSREKCCEKLDEVVWGCQRSRAETAAFN